MAQIFIKIHMELLLTYILYQWAMTKLNFTEGYYRYVPTECFPEALQDPWLQWRVFIMSATHYIVYVRDCDSSRIIAGELIHAMGRRDWRPVIKTLKLWN